MAGIQEDARVISEAAEKLAEELTDKLERDEELRSRLLSYGQKAVDDPFCLVSIPALASIQSRVIRICAPDLTAFAEIAKAADLVFLEEVVRRKIEAMTLDILEPLFLGAPESLEVLKGFKNAFAPPKN